MRPIRLLLDGFGCYREPAEADFSDVDFFALTGPTGSGKSTVIDGLCFALYGTVPRWGNVNVINQALAPTKTECRVALVFEVAGQRYGVERLLGRNARGQVTTKLAMIHQLDPSVSPGAPLVDLLGAAAVPLAEGPDHVKTKVQEILGLTYEHFTQSVLLPQGRFAEFLHAKPADRQDLLVELLAFGVYATIGQRARDRAKQAALQLRMAQNDRDTLTDATAEAEEAAAARVTELDEVSYTVTERLASLDLLRTLVERSARQASDARLEAAVLAAVRTPAQVADLAGRLAVAKQQITDRKAALDAAELAESASRKDRDGLPDKTALGLLARAHSERRELQEQLADQEPGLTARQAKEQVAKGDLEAAEREIGNARDRLAAAERSNMAATLAHDLHVGDDCPVCQRALSEPPRPDVPVSLTDAKVAVGHLEERLIRARVTQQQATTAVAAASSSVESLRGQLARLGAGLDGAPSETEVAVSLAAIGKADQALALAQQRARTARDELSTAERQRAALADAERQAWAALGRARDSVVHLGAPELENADLAGDWARLSGWASQQHEERTRRQPELDAAAADLRRQVAEAAADLAGLLAEHGIEAVTEPARAEAAVATARANAANRLTAVRDNRAKAGRLDEQIAQHKEEEQVASKLGNLLKATAFEGWLCGEALDSLVADATQVLKELSGGQYALGRSERNDLEVIDYFDVGATRPVHTLSGGETFQASLALALALSRQVVGLSAGMREMNSMFLDEGFGTLDPASLETVGATLEGLVADSDRMIGIVTHVTDLAERAGTRFVVSRSGATSTLRKVGP
jgi:DNA repair protein SbcC/Rad50